MQKINNIHKKSSRKTTKVTLTQFQYGLNAEANAQIDAAFKQCVPEQFSSAATNCVKFYSKKSSPPAQNNHCLSEMLAPTTPTQIVNRPPIIKPVPLHPQLFQQRPKQLLDSMFKQQVKNQNATQACNTDREIEVIDLEKKDSAYPSTKDDDFEFDLEVDNNFNFGVEDIAASQQQANNSPSRILSPLSPSLFNLDFLTPYTENEEKSKFVLKNNY